MFSSRTITLLLFLLVLCLPSYCPAESKANAKKKYNAVQKEIKTKKAKLARAKKKEKKALNDIDKTNKELRLVSQKLKRYQRKISGTRRRAKTIELEIAVLSDKIKERRGWLRNKIRAMHRHGKYGDVLLLIGASEDFSQALRRWRYLEALSNHERHVMEDFLNDMKTLKSKGSALEGEEKEECHAGLG
jgi:peptidoglycan hydrolase CwlO-like protein